MCKRLVFLYIVSVAAVCLLPNVLMAALGDMTSLTLFGDPSNSNMALLRAALEGRGQDIKKYLSQGADVNCCLLSPLAGAAQNGHMEVLRLLVEKGADIDGGKTPCPSNQPCATPLIYAVHGGHVELVKYLLQNGADPNRKSRGVFSADIEDQSNGQFAIKLTAKYEKSEKTALGWTRDPVIKEILKAHGAIDE